MTIKAQTPPKPCATCKGKGWVFSPKADMRRKKRPTKPCPSCHGTRREKT